ncbi:uncharacterized protein LY79DRAFT_551241 [Colletotrichum navitas]|uniref:Xylanolytic transcriptional activator regulatory domain-containing protein n=1 Tax=Colletotrichum navitas TaxID=681940 RepID=A0AAD8V6T2_9PEZI|nr:uncharacterized protein LY79DRAFT_551241 [Colletotrichum navitas]KAK1593901.1 hypothetical protein LY79DRAFT_551241 [Colletotrichum navitas]
MVCTLGSVASGSDSLHVHYYKQARAHLDIDSLGSGNMESLQALCLLGGYYLHYRNSPNMAYAGLGAAHRVAIALGLHRKPVPRRRTWWSLFCLDTWASMTLGRPTCDRWDGSTMDTLLPSSLLPDDHVAASLRASCLFCHICDRIQHRFAQHARSPAQEALAFDRELREWHASLPEYMRDPANSPPRLTMARELMRNRYLSVLLILSRCFLPYLAQGHGLRRPASSSSSKSNRRNRPFARYLHWPLPACRRQHPWPPGARASSRPSRSSPRCAPGCAPRTAPLKPSRRSTRLSPPRLTNPEPPPGPRPAHPRPQRTASWTCSSGATSSSRNWTGALTSASAATIGCISACLPSSESLPRCADATTWIMGCLLV